MATETLKVGRAWDDTFQEWTDDLQLGKKLKKPARAIKGKSVWSGAAKTVSQPAEYKGKGSKSDVRGRLLAVAKGGRQVMVKITPGKNTTIAAVRRHLQYISQDGEQTVQDQDGNTAQGKEAIQDFAWAWEYTGPTMPSHSEHRLAFNIMFSMPEGTDERAVYAAVRATAEIEFAGHQWVLGQHFDEPQVHCHLCVKAEGLDGTRLNPRKVDLNRWRERFAHELRTRGIEAEATKRATRLHQKLVKKPWAVSRVEDRGGVTKNTHSPANEKRIKKWQDTEKLAASSYTRIIAALHQSDDAADRILAKELEKSLVGAQVRKTTEHLNKPKRDLERT
jgi:Relaxase/Mobilisation nuclease domain